jgi:predicted protein tyrosine phosphatase
MNEPQKLLFVCTENRMRSLTAEMLYEGFPGYEVKSAGTELSARIPVTQEHVQWADMIFVMEPEHEQILQEQFGQALEEKNVICLNIPDIYCYMEPALIDELKAALSGHVEVPE